ncbi:MAG: hypothetical protein LC802_21540 [Acidobacteria bacterium]|nr:hypothetical protein [Acidobacteriota bacterium]
MSLPFTPIIQRFDSLPSTNTEAARQAAEGAPGGLCIVAREQTAGRGRRERAWVSTKDAGLYFSIVLRPRFDASGWPLITLAAALAVHDALREACGLSTDIPDGAARIVREWETRSTYARGLRVGVALVAETFEGTTRGLEPDGALRVETDAHEIRIVRAGDVRALRSEPRRRQM